jgi:hypothetical protein
MTVLLALLAPAPSPAQDPDGGSGTKVYRVESVRLSLEKSNPPNLVVEALGKVRTSGWTNARLVMRGNGPKDGVYEFDFVASRPTGITHPVILPVTATTVVEKVGPDVKGVRVYAETNDRAASLASSKSDSGSEETTDPQKRKPCAGAYRAQQLPDKTILVIASGVHNTGGYKVSLEPKQRDAGAAGPPEFELWHEAPEGLVTQVFTPFTTSAWAKASGSPKSVPVYDADGRHDVPVESTPDLRAH